MSQCVPSWDVDDNNNNPPPPRVSLRSNSDSTAPDVSMLDYKVAELTWENGQPSMHGLGLPHVPAKPSNTPSRYTWEKPRASGTLESIVNQASSLPHGNGGGKLSFDGTSGGGGDNGDDSGVHRNVLVPWFDPHCVAAVAATTSNTVTMDALVPCSNPMEEQTMHVMNSIPRGIGACMVGSSTHVGAGTGTATREEGGLLATAAKRARVARVPVEAHKLGRDQSVSGSATFGKDSQHVTLDTCDRELDLGFTSTSLGSPENTISAKQCTKTTTVDDHDSVCHSRPMREDGDEEEQKKGIGKSSGSTKRSRAAAIHNQSERKRRDKINQRMKTLQKLVPNSSKTDKASMLDEVIEYLKQLQAQVQMMNRINMSSMMLPMALQQQLQMSMMAPMGMGMGMGMSMGMGMGMDMNTMSRANIPGIRPVLHPSAFMPMASWDGASGDRHQGSPAPVMPDPLFTYFGCQSQPMTMDAYSRIAAMYQQLHQPPASGSKS